MLEQIQALHTEISSYRANTPEDIEIFRRKFIAKKGEIAALFHALREVPPHDKQAWGKALNRLKDKASEKFKMLAGQAKATKSSEVPPEEDPTLPPPTNTLGNLHPLTRVSSDIVALFERIGFSVSEGPEIEDDWHNFTALNFPKNHPARDMQDTFFLSGDKALRTHTSSAQVRVMETQPLPIRTMVTGRVFRNEDVSARTHCIFHQLEGLYINQGVSFVDLKETLLYFVKEMFGYNTKLRFRPSYFPFTEPSAELDIDCRICKGKGCNVCKHTGWVEIMGAGMIDPQVFAHTRIDPSVYTGFAFGMGIERIAMLKYQIGDLRLFTENDVRFLAQF